MPVVPPVSITPFIVGQPCELQIFTSMDVSRSDTARLPQDLTKFIAAGTITQDMLTASNFLIIVLPPLPSSISSKAPECKLTKAALWRSFRESLVFQNLRMKQI
jgi:hypothetical protein